MTETDPPVRRATAREIEYMRKIGRYKQESHDMALAAHLALSGTERLVKSAMWTRAMSGHPGWRFRTDDRPELFYEKAKERGLYKG